MGVPIQACPKCGGTDLQPAVVLKNHFNIWLFLLGGWLLSLLWAVSRKEVVRCVQCETVFHRSTRASIVALVLLILLGLLVLLGLWAMISEGRL
jgi:uncharacterized integral membrane protein